MIRIGHSGYGNRVSAVRFTECLRPFGTLRAMSHVEWLPVPVPAERQSSSSSCAAARRKTDLARRRPLESGALGPGRLFRV